MIYNQKDVIPLDELDFFSSASPAHWARLLEWNGSLYRAVYPSSVQFYEENRLVFEKLMTKGLLVETEPTKLKVEGYGLLLKHKRISFVTYPFEWPARALKDAALLFLDLNLELARHGLATRDAHSLNVLFDGVKPVFVDFDSFARLTEINFRVVKNEFYGTFLFPLHIMANGQRRIARLIMRDPTTAISKGELELFELSRNGSFQNLARGYASSLASRMPSALKRPVRNLIKNHKKRVIEKESTLSLQAQWTKTLRHLRDQVEQIELHPGDSNWLNYYDINRTLEENGDWTKKQAIVSSVLKEFNPETVLDIGTNTGWFAQLAAHLGSDTAACDIDEDCLDHLFTDLKTKKLTVTPAHLNLRNPTTAYGWGGKRYDSAMKRLGADCVLALALIHHLVFRQLADFDLIIEGLSGFVRKDLVLEFVGKEDQYVQKWWTDGYSWYRLDNLVEKLQLKFQRVRILPSHPPSRKLLICENIKAS